ncbi:Ring canal kelch protein [Gryllus bimaculatus]|nr:Ring canal kelch protein [Gryllus bimaculatus]
MGSLTVEFVKMDGGDNCVYHVESGTESASQQQSAENGEELELGGQAAMVEGRAEAEANGGAAGAGGEALSFCDERLPGAALQALHLMQRSRRFCDVVLHVGGGAELHAHRAVLAAASPHLLELFSADEEVKGHQVASVYRAASLLRMDRCARECARHLLRHLTVDNCLQTRALPGLAHDRAFAEQIDAFIAREFDAVSKSKILLSLVCVRVEVLNQTRQEMSLVVGDSISRLALDWMKRQFADDDNLQLDKLTEKTHLLYLAMDNSLQDCTEMPTSDLSDTEIVQDYKKLSLKNHTNTKQNKRKTQLQPAKPRVLIYSRDIGPRTNQEKDDDWKLIAATKVGEHNFLALVVLNGYLTTLSVQLRCSQPLSPSPVATPITSRPASEEKPDLYCVMPNMSSVKCAVGCANLNNSLLVCGGYDRAECLRIVEAYDPQHNSWASLPPMREPRGRFDIAVVRGKVYAVGGSNGSSELSTVEVFDPERQKWCSIDPLPLARCNTGM